MVWTGTTLWCGQGQLYPFFFIYKLKYMCKDEACFKKLYISASAALFVLGAVGAMGEFMYI
jgi:hypothetical protein